MKIIAASLLLAVVAGLLYQAYVRQTAQVRADAEQYKVTRYETLKHNEYPFSTCTVVAENKTSRLYADVPYPCGSDGDQRDVSIGDAAEKGSNFLFVPSLRTNGARSFRIYQAEAK